MLVTRFSADWISAAWLAVAAAGPTALDPRPESLADGAATPAVEVEPIDPAALPAQLRGWEREHPGLCTAAVYGHSAQGRELWSLRLAPLPLAPARPALLLVAGLEADRPFEPALCLDLARRLLAGAAAGEPAVVELLEAYTVHLVPLADPDGAARFAAGQPLGAGPDVDQDRDGRRGEDSPQDLDGDGRVLWMRVPDADGPWAADPTDSAAAVPADALRRRPAQFRLEPEGLDRDGDGRIAEDPAGDRLFEANFPAQWPEHTPRAGHYPTDDPAARALCDLVIAHRELVLVLAYGSLDGLTREPSAAGRGSGAVPAPGWMEADLPFAAELARRYRESTAAEPGDDGDRAGSFVAWCSDHRGLWTLPIRPWSLPTAAPAAEAATEPPPPETNSTAETAPSTEETESEESLPEPEAPAAPPSEQDESEPPPPSEDAGRLAWIAARGETWRFAPWQPFDHPTLGAVEIGGFAPGSHSVPPRDEWDSLAQAQFRFLLELADTAPSLALEDFRAERLGPGLWRATVEVRNRGWLPIASAAAERARTCFPPRLRLQLEGGQELIAGEREQALPNLLGGASLERTWLVRGADPRALRLGLESAGAGLAVAAPRLVEEAR
jgi:hypothetical protein